jgi:hypothetical protein
VANGRGDGRETGKGHGSVRKKNDYDKKEKEVRK